MIARLLEWWRTFRNHPNIVWRSGRVAEGYLLEGKGNL
jgi:hypothetical protein